MRTVEVTTPGGQRWGVRVVWEPRWRVMARRFGGWRSKRRHDDVGPGDVLGSGAQVSSDVGSSGGSLGDELAIIAVVLFAFVAVGVVFWWVLLPLLLIILDGLIVLALLTVSVVARVLFRRPWIVRATAVPGPGGRRTTREGAVETEVVGWRAALRRRDAMADSLRRGLNPATVEDAVVR